LSRLLTSYRVIRAYTHFSHLLCLYAVSNRVSKTLSQDGDELGAILLSYLPSLPVINTSNLRDSLKSLVEIFHSTFSIEDFFLSNDSESPLILFEDGTCPSLNHKSVVLGFIGLLLNMGIKARLVASLHPIALSFAKGSEKAPRRKSNADKTPRKRKKKDSSSESVKKPSKKRKMGKKASKKLVAEYVDSDESDDGDVEMVSRASSVKGRKRSVSSEDEEELESKSTPSKSTARKSPYFVESDDEGISRASSSRSKKRAPLKKRVISSDEGDEKKRVSSSKGKRRAPSTMDSTSEEEIIPRDKRQQSSTTSSSTTIKQEKPTPVKSEVSAVISLLDDEESPAVEEIISLLSEDEEARQKAISDGAFYPVRYWCEVLDGSEWHIASV
jgi:hypothetical protein